jgi:hypothetical protein
MIKLLSPFRALFIALMFVSLACNFLTGAGGSNNEPTAPPVLEVTDQPPAESDARVLRQWANSAVASSEYGPESWGAKQATGAPNVNECGDNGLAWASESSNSVEEWIELTYAVPVVPTEITVYQSYNPSQVVEVDVIAADGVLYPIWIGAPKLVEGCPNQLTLPVELEAEIAIQKVRVVIDQSVLDTSWNEIDAVELVGKP